MRLLLFFALSVLLPDVFSLNPICKPEDLKEPDNADKIANYIFIFDMGLDVQRMEQWKYIIKAMSCNFIYHKAIKMAIAEKRGDEIKLGPYFTNDVLEERITPLVGEGGQEDVSSCPTPASLLQLPIDPTILTHFVILVDTDKIDGCDMDDEFEKFFPPAEKLVRLDEVHLGPYKESYYERIGRPWSDVNPSVPYLSTGSSFHDVAHHGSLQEKIWQWVLDRSEQRPRRTKIRPEGDSTTVIQQKTTTKRLSDEEVQNLKKERRKGSKLGRNQTKEDAEYNNELNNNYTTSHNNLESSSSTVEETTTGTIFVPGPIGITVEMSTAEETTTTEEATTTTTDVATTEATVDTTKEATAETTTVSTTEEATTTFEAAAVDITDKNTTATEKNTSDSDEISPATSSSTTANFTEEDAAEEGPAKLIKTAEDLGTSIRITVETTTAEKEKNETGKILLPMEISRTSLETTTEKEGILIGAAVPEEKKGIPDGSQLSSTAASEEDDGFVGWMTREWIYVLIAFLVLCFLMVALIICLLWLKKSQNLNSKRKKKEETGKSTRSKEYQAIGGSLFAVSPAESRQRSSLSVENEMFPAATAITVEECRPLMAQEHSDPMEDTQPRSPGQRRPSSTGLGGSTRAQMDFVPLPHPADGAVDPYSPALPSPFDVRNSEVALTPVRSVKQSTIPSRFGPRPQIPPSQLARKYENMDSNDFFDL